MHGVIAVLWRRLATNSVSLLPNWYLSRPCMGVVKPYLTISNWPVKS